MKIKDLKTENLEILKQARPESKVECSLPFPKQYVPQNEFEENEKDFYSPERNHKNDKYPKEILTLVSNQINQKKRAKGRVVIRTKHPSSASKCNLRSSSNPSLVHVKSCKANIFLAEKSDPNIEEEKLNDECRRSIRKSIQHFTRKFKDSSEQKLSDCIDEQLRDSKDYRLSAQLYFNDGCLDSSQESKVFSISATLQNLNGAKLADNSNLKSFSRSKLSKDVTIDIRKKLSKKLKINELATKNKKVIELDPNQNQRYSDEKDQRFQTNGFIPGAPLRSHSNINIYK